MRPDVLSRCTRCVLPETFPRIQFDSEGVCNYCLSFTPVRLRGEAALASRLERAKRDGAEYDCIVTLSGGRDSTYVLYQAVKKYGLRVLAMTYDNGLLHPVAHENMRRATSLLGVPHIIVAGKPERAVGDLKRNLSAWIKKPSLAMIPTFMISGKVAEFHVARLAKHKNIPIILDGTTEVEQTHFKLAYLGVRETALGEVRHRDLVRLVGRYVTEYIRNPAYINSSLFRAIASFFVFFIYRRFVLTGRQVRFFEYEPWDEALVLSTIREHLGWESPADTNATWRTDDVVSCLYNWLYFTLVGFTESDALYSNMIRYGMISRATALEQLLEENKPRYEAISALLEKVGVKRHVSEIEQRLSRVSVTRRGRL